MESHSQGHRTMRKTGNFIREKRMPSAGTCYTTTGKSGKPAGIMSVKTQSQQQSISHLKSWSCWYLDFPSVAYLIHFICAIKKGKIIDAISAPWQSLSSFKGASTFWMVNRDTTLTMEVILVLTNSGVASQGKLVQCKGSEEGAIKVTSWSQTWQSVM